MRKGIPALAIVLFSLSSAFGQGTVLFANRVVPVFDAPVTLSGLGVVPGTGPGPEYTAQLNLQGADGSLTPLAPTSTFFASGSGVQAIADRYWEPKVVEVPGFAPGELATFVVRVWKTSYGSFEAAQTADLEAFPLRFAGNSGSSLPFSVVVGGGSLPPADLVALQGFSMGFIPEPSVLSLAGLGLGIAWVARLRRPNR